MPIFTVSLLSNITVSATVEITTDNQADALAAAEKLHDQGALTWNFNGAPIPVFSGPLTSIWANPGITPPPGPRKRPIVLSISPTRLILGNDITISATIAPGATGLVTFYSGMILLGSTTPNIFGVATIVVTPPIGIQQITSIFAGDIYFGPNTSNSVQITVLTIPTITTLTASPNPQSSGQNVLMTANVVSDGLPPGLVIFMDGNIQIGANVLVGGNCSITVDTLSIGTHALTAIYQGSTDYSNSTSNIINEVISP